MKASLFLLTLAFTTQLILVQSTPLNQLGYVINNTTAKLSLLANNGFNNANFNSMVSLLNNLFANMQILSEPYFNSMISQIANQNNALLSQIITLENQTAAQSTVIFRFIDAASTTLSSQLGNIGGILTTYQNVVNPSLCAIKQSMSSMNTSASSLPSLTASIDQTNGQIQNTINSLLVEQALDQIEYKTIRDNLPYISKFALSSLTLTSSDLSFCKTFSYNFIYNFVLAPIVYADLMSLTDPSTVGYSEMDIILLSSDSSSANFMVCDRSFSTFSLIDSWVEVSLFSVDL